MKITVKTTGPFSKDTGKYYAFIYPLSYRQVEETLKERGIGIDHTPVYRFIKKMCKPMLWFSTVKSARATLCGIELHHMLKEGQHKTLNHQPIWEQFCSLAG